jgi:Uma2 family endonuclease
MSTLSSPLLTPEQYLKIDRAAETKSEYFEGRMFAMSGGPLAHSALQAALSLVVGQRLNRSRCTMLGSDMRIQVSATGLYTYPDFAVVCGEPQFADGERDTLLNPIVVAEVLSPSSERYDRAAKFAHYRTLEYLRHYVLVSQDGILVEVFSRAGSQWDLSAATEPGDIVRLSAIQVEFPVELLYEGIRLSDTGPSRWPKNRTR